MPGLTTAARTNSPRTRISCTSWAVPPDPSVYRFPLLNSADRIYCELRITRTRSDASIVNPPPKRFAARRCCSHLLDSN